MLKYVGFLLVLVLLILGGYYFLQVNQAPTPEPHDAMGLEVRGESPNYFENIQGFYAEPQEPGNYPGVVMIHEWWGLNDHIRAQAKELASEGYRVLAVDLFGSVATTPDEARAQVSDLDQEAAIENMEAAIRFLRARGATSLASLGWCFGGGQSLQLALARGDADRTTPPLGLDATVIYYGNLVTERDKLRGIQWPVLGIFGETDQSIATTSIYAFRDSLVQLGVPNEIHVYPGVGHAFANPSNAGFAPAETADAWAKTLAFLEENLK
ncbi:hypothetical protein A3A38_03645 [Candidatus Kaiserbacteria bacterium RIFCSPLOWO2_01_FULL_53_17]|uniref:Dienelactone hydrolase domain-containing protein n=1 Tax=Candidatus Kaiserbacteria bacterium RIFCSPLOWO2_01_FULL_53_17 TaxID=1798511 RepID=A0A1F6EGE5_9BACT|nr:MAG: hypothetical protein A3A38_03645 [Candidatus Kaiserbacteria bacterium RIFCSPLOWO2_01_FULL_53_17]